MMRKQWNRRMAGNSIVFLGLVAACGGGTSGGTGSGPGAGEVDVYARTVQPILNAACSCHTPDNPVGGYPVAKTPYLSLFSLGLVTRGSPEDSLLLTSMPIGQWNQYFTASQVEVLSQWIRMGAPQYAAADDLGGGGGADYAGARSCSVCHTRITPIWLGGAHANLEARDDSHRPLDLGLSTHGYPPYGYYGLGTDPDCTLVCHDPLGDGFDLAPNYTGNVPRPVVGCEACHGPGGDHFGSGPIPYARPGAARCAPCHNASFDHNRYYPEGDEIYEDYAASPHARSINDHTYAQEGSTAVRALCAKCHTDEGARAFQAIDGGYDDLSGSPTFAVAQPVAGATPIQCRTCHDPHAPDELLEPALLDGDGRVVESAEYRTCTNCHQVTDSYHGENSRYSWSGYAVGSGVFSGASIIYDTHFDDGSQPAGARDPTTIEGYVLDPASERVCRDCHNVHACDTTINQQWARSGHGGRILEAKEAAAADPAQADTAAILTAGVTGDYGAAWANYDFKDASRRSCQYCHTSTGFRNFVSAPETYDPADNDFVASGSQRELLYCWACHPDSAGGVHDPGALSIAYPGTSAATGYPDLGPSNVCVACHAGRETGRRIAQLDPGGLADLGFISPHYMAATGILFRTTGYQFADDEGNPLSYADVPYFAHAAVGSTVLDAETGATVEARPGTGTSGPCVGCHMTLPPKGEAEAAANAGAGEEPAGQPVANHLLLAYSSEAGRAHEEPPVCATCHANHGGMTAALAKEEKAHYRDALAALAGQAAQRGFHLIASYPYLVDAEGAPVRNWYTDTNGNGYSAIDANGDGKLDAPDPDDAWTGIHNLGACFNLSLLKGEPGAFAHNRIYAKRLIYDSIDWLDDHALNGSVDQTLAALGDDTAYKAGARAYLGPERP
ncbi:MAG: cytochrome c3 family protein [Thermodesulfobacteriota bacterium]